MPTSIEAMDEIITRPSPEVIAVVEKMPGPIAVLGAGGKMGYHLSALLQRSLGELGRTDQVTAVSRFQNSGVIEKFQKAGISARSADLIDPAQVEQLPDAAFVFFLAGIKFGTAHHPDLLEAFNVRMPSLVADRYRAAQIVALSTGCVYPFTTPESGGSTEHTPTDPPGAYALSCLGREQAFASASERFGTRCALIRLNYANDLRYGVLVDIAQRVLNERPLNVETGFVNVIWQGDALEHIVRTMPMTAAPPCVLNVTGSETLRVRELGELFAQRLAKPLKVEGTEAGTAWLSNATQSHRWFGPPKVAVEVMIDWISDWLLAGRDTLGKPTQFENRGGSF